LADTLKGKKILITRPSIQGEEFETMVREYGGVPVLLPVIDIKPLNFVDKLKKSLEEKFDWIVFTSANGVRFAFEFVKNHSVKFCAIGPATAREIRKRNGHVDFVPDEFTAKKIAKSLPVTRGDRVLLLRAKIAPPDLRLGLENRGVFVKEIPIYDTIEKKYSPHEVREKLSPVPDFSTFTSSSTFRSFLNIIKTAGIDPRGYFSKTTVAAIGPVTAGTILEEGFEPHIVAQDHTVRGLINAITGYVYRALNEAQEVSDVT